MLEYLGQCECNARKVYYLKPGGSTDWAQQLPKGPWLLAPIADKCDREFLNLVTIKNLNKNVVYVCALGDESEWIHDFFDEIIVIQQTEQAGWDASLCDFSYCPITTWHTNFEEGVWFALMVADKASNPVNTVIFLNIDDVDRAKDLRELIATTNQSWLTD